MRRSACGRVTTTASIVFWSCHGLSGVLIIEDDAFDERTDVNTGRLLDIAVGCSGIGHALAHKPFDFRKIADQLVLLRTVLRHLGTKFHARNRCLKIVGDGGKDLHALFQVMGDPIPHGVERRRGIGDFLRSGLLQPSRLLAGIQGLGCIGEPKKGSDRQTHRQPGAKNEKQELCDQNIGKPVRKRHDPWPQVDRHLRLIAERHMGLETLRAAGNGFNRDRKAPSRRLIDGFGNLGAQTAEFGNSREAWTEFIPVVPPLQHGDPLLAFARGEAIEQGNRGADVFFQIAKHHRLGGHVALEKQDAEGKGMRGGQSGKEDEKKPPPQGSRKMQEPAKPADRVHGRAVVISTGIART